MRLAFLSQALTVLTLASALADAPDSPRKPGRAASSARPVHAVPAARAQARPGTKAAAGPGEGNPALAPPNQGSSNSADQVFLTQARLANLAEIELANLAEQNAASSSVRDFARQMIRDHEQADRNLRRLAEADDVPATDRLDAENRQVRDALGRLSGAMFDIEYLRLQVQAHQRMVQLLEYVIGSGRNVQIQRFASGELPGVFTHLAMASQLLDQSSMQNPRIASAPPRKVSGMPTPQTPRASEN